MGEESEDCTLWGLSIPSNKKGRKIRPFDAFAVLFFLKTEFFLQIVDVSATMLEVLVIHDADLQINVGFDTVDDQLLQRILHASNRHVTVFTVANQAYRSFES
ncbi:Uncharacterised protein [Escherichia coli]|uniref:Uncharacterized protein n=1 Tax=Escherichia coli TaxID=562 RepID=A0A2X3JZM3_ECOLX|nr:Uncharacterised protein [Escherichia coli]